MPVNIRIMNWNIEQLSWNKIQINGMADAIARVIYGMNIDIVVILEVRKVYRAWIMSMLTNAINNLQPGGAPPYYWLTSRSTGGEHYGFIIRNINTIRPLQFAINPNAPLPLQKDGTAQRPLSNLHALRWTTWPVAFPAAAPHPPPAFPLMPLINTFVSPNTNRPTKIRKTNFAGQNIGNGGYSEGRGYRMPCLAIFVVQGPNALTYLPIVVCHYAAVRGGRNFLAQQQIRQLNQLHIAQLFSFYDASVLPALAPECGFLDIDNAAVPITNIIYTGDFNVNFLRNDPGGDHTAITNHEAFVGLTPTLQNGASTTPPAAAGALPALVPLVPFNVFPPAPEAAEIPVQTLRASCTTWGTILKKVALIPPPHPPAKPGTLPPAPPNYLAIRDGAIDNFFYGGAEANTAVVNFGPNNTDSGAIINVPSSIRQVNAAGAPPAPPNTSVSGPRNFYAAPPATKRAHLAPNLSGTAGVAPALTINDEWIGSRLLSDHLPVIIQIACP